MRRSSRTLRRVTTRAKWLGSGRWPSRCRWCLGSATPSLESWYAAQRGEYRLVEMPRRVSALPLPDVATVDLRTQRHGRRAAGIHQPAVVPGRAGSAAGRRPGDPAAQSARVFDHDPVPGLRLRRQMPALRHCLDPSPARGQRPPATTASTRSPTPARCPECKFEDIRYSGVGTQKLEVEVQSRFPDVPCLRMDSDSMAKPGSHEEALDRFRSGEVKILVGTQMIAKGLDFPNVTLVGVINADTALHFPDFRAAERTFQLVTQVAGRTGRGARRSRAGADVQSGASGHRGRSAARLRAVCASRNCRCAASSAIRPWRP